MRDIGGIVAWLVGGAHDALVPEVLLTGLGERLVAAGVPLDRAAIFVRTLDPDVAGRRFAWHRGRAFEMADAGFDLFESERYLANPVARVQRTGQPIRRRLSSEAGSGEFPLLSEMLADGFTDYLATPLFFSNGEVHVIGPAVNLVARLERLARKLDRSVIASAAFARICGEALTMLGSFALRGFTSPQPAYGLPGESVPVAGDTAIQA